MSRPGRIPALQQQTYVLTAREVAQLYFRRGEDYVKTGQVRDEFPTFPQPGLGGLYHRGQVECWFDLIFGMKADSGRDARQAQMLEEAKLGTGSREATARRND